MRATDGSAIISSTILTAGAGETPPDIRGFPEDHHAIPFEVMEGDGEVSITALLPPGCDSEPPVTFLPLNVGITLDGETSVVDLPCRIDVRSCSFRVKNGMDITCRKA